MAKKIKRDINDPIELEVLKQNAQLGNVPNVTTNNQTPTWSMATTLSNIASGETLTIIMGKISKTINDTISHIGNKNNPHSVTKSQISLGNVENKSGATIRSEMTKEEVVDALGYTPPITDTKYNQATSSALGLVKIGYTENGKNYPVELSSGQMFVNVPWTDTNTTYGLSSTTANGLLKQLSGNTSQFMRGDGTWATPPNTTYGVATSSKLGLVKSGTDITVDSSGNVNVVGGDVNTAQTLKTARTINGVSFNGSANITITANPKENQLTNQNLNDIKTSGEYYAGESNRVTNKPSNIDAFSLQVVRSAGGYYTQILIGGNNNPNKMFIRTYQSGTWTSWYSFYSSKYPQTSVSGNAGTATKLQTARKIAGTSFDGTEDISISYNNLTDKPTIPSGVQVINNLTSSSTTASLAANQGRVLKGYLDKKIVVSSTQPSGQQIGDTWYQII